jgi:L-ribulokinase
MSRLNRDVWLPDSARSENYDRLFAIYRQLHDHFGQEVPAIMHSLGEQRREALSP